MHPHKLEILQTLNFIVPKIPELVNYYRLNFSNSSSLIKASAAAEFTYKDKSYIFIIAALDIEKENRKKAGSLYLNLKPEEIKKYPYLTVIVNRLLGGLAEIDLLSDCMPSGERETLYPKFYKNQISFLIKYVKQEAAAILTSNFETLKDTTFGLCVEKEEKTLCKLLVAKCSLTDGNRNYEVYPDRNNNPYPYKKELIFAEAEANFPLLAIH